MNIPSPRFPYDICLYVFQLGCPNWSTFPVAGVERPMSTCSKIVRNWAMLRKKYVLPKFWDNLDSRKAQIKNHFFFLHFSAFHLQRYLDLKQKPWPAWEFLNKKSKFADFSSQLYSSVSIFFFVCRCGTVHMLYQTGSFRMTSYTSSHWISFLLPYLGRRFNIAHWYSATGMHPCTI